MPVWVGKNKNDNTVLSVGRRSLSKEAKDRCTDANSWVSSRDTLTLRPLVAALNNLLNRSLSALNVLDCPVVVFTWIRCIEQNVLDLFLVSALRNGCSGLSPNQLSKISLILFFPRCRTVSKSSMMSVQMDWRTLVSLESLSHPFHL